VDGGYIIPEGVYITRGLRQKFLDLKIEYRDQYKSRLSLILLRDLPKIPSLFVLKLLRASAREEKDREALRSPTSSVPFRERRTYREERAAQEERVKRARVVKGKQKGF
jgi:hypothetical protein